MPSARFERARYERAGVHFEQAKYLQEMKWNICITQVPLLGSSDRGAQEKFAFRALCQRLGITEQIISNSSVVDIVCV